MEDAEQQDPSPLAYFHGEFHAPRAGLGYQLALVAVCAATLLLPLIYILFVAAIGFAIAWYGFLGLQSMFAEGIPIFALAFCVGLMLAGFLVVLFLCKPFLAAPAVSEDAFSLDHEHQPELFRFLGKLCQVMECPLPSRIDVDCEVNAAARFRGGLRDLFRNDFVLIIGLPLAAGLSARQFAGIVAHELGHFSQRAGTRIDHIIWKVNGWLAQAATERDEWDDWLDRACALSNVRVGVFLWLARFGIFITRIPLRCLYYIGAGLALCLRRQGEFNADQYAAIVAGTNEYIGTLEALTALQVATQAASATMSESWKERRLIDNLPELVAHQARAFTEETHNTIRKARAGAKAGLFSTHPTDPARFAAVRKLNEPGLFTCEAPAFTLFREFSELCREATRRRYLALGIRLNPGNLKDLDTSLNEQQTRQKAQQQLHSGAPGATAIWQPLDFDPAYIGAPADPDATRAALETARARIGEELEAFSASVAEHVAAEKTLITAICADALASAGIKFDPANYGIAETEASGLAARAVRLRAESEQRLADQLPRQQLYLARMVAALQLLHHPPIAAAIENASAKQAEVLQLVEALSKLKRIAKPLREAVLETMALRAVFNHGEKAKDGVKIDRCVTILFRKLDRNVMVIRTQLLGGFYPFDHASGRITLNDFCRPGTITGDAQYQTFMAASAYLERLPDIYTRSVSRVSAIAAEVEEHLWPADPAGS